MRKNADKTPGVLCADPQSYKGYIIFDYIQGNPCPSTDCWIYDSDENECRMLSGADCFKVQCDYNDFHLSFKSNLYGVEEGLVNQFEPIAMV